MQVAREFFLPTLMGDDLVLELITTEVFVLVQFGPYASRAMQKSGFLLSREL